MAGFFMPSLRVMVRDCALAGYGCAAACVPFQEHINIPASGLQFVVVIFEIGVAFVLCGLSRKQLFLFCS